ncbi:MAG: iron ABC transporter permease [Thermomicrobiales bacterium]|nr:iron ABC transporter permease [Thermomicrobiales bacterium]
MIHPTSGTRGIGSRSLLPIGLIVLIGILLVVGMLSLRIGSLSITTADAWNALFHYNPDVYEQLVVRTLRLPRTIYAIVVGAGLGLSGTIAQAITRNPLADPSILGVSSGATLAVVVAVFFFNLTAPYQYVWFAFAGALLAALLVFIMSTAGKGGASPAKVALAGIVVSAMLSAWTSALLLLDRETMDVVRFWLAGSVAGRNLDTLYWLAPFILGGSAIGLLLGHQLNVLSLGDETARALGMQTSRLRAIGLILVVVITGAAVAAAGPIAFIGLATPHLVRSIIGPDYRWVLPYSMVVGAILLTSADVIGRVVARPAEVHVGIVTAVVGAPVLIAIARRRTLAS